MVQVSVNQQSNQGTPSNMPLACTLKPVGMSSADWSKWRQEHCRNFYDNKACEEANTYHLTGSVSPEVLKDFLQCKAEENNLEPLEVDLYFGSLF